MKNMITLIHQKLMSVFLSGIVLLASQCSFAQQLAFPGAEGFGKYAVGGRNGTVVHVTNLNDVGAGSLRDAVSASNRIVVFDVAGVIRINARIVVSSNIYLAGQTAPGEGITVYGNGWSFSGASNAICRYMKIRMGEVGSSGNDANGIANGHDMIFDHCSISWGRDETFSINAPDALNITIQNTAMTQGLLTHSAGGLIQTNGGVTLYRNLYADNGTRNNKLKGVNQYVNNIVYNWSAGAYIMGGDSEGESFSNAVSNLFIQGPVPGNRPFSVGNNKYHIYATDNLHDSDHNGIFNPYIIQPNEFGGGPDFQATPYAYPILPTVAANTLLDQSLPTVGASLPYRDYVDYYVVNEVKSLGIRGQFIGNETALPFGVPSSWSLWPGTKRVDTDNDGIPDDWETAHNLNPNLATDAMVVTANGYTNIENFINGIDSNYSQTYLRAPLSLVMDSATQNSVSLSWYDYTEKEKGYIIEQKINGVFTQIGQTGINGNTFKITGLQPEEKDTFRVKAFSGTNFSDYSNVLATKSKPVPVAVLNPNAFVPDLVWSGATNQDWDKTTANWFGNGTAANFTDSSKLQFNTLLSSQTINLTAQMGAKEILVKSDADYIIQGAGNIAGSGSVNKYGTGKLSLFTNNTYIGATVISGGTLEINKLANGGLASSIGASLPYAFNWVWKGGKINYTGGTTSTDRNVSLDATTEFSVANAASVNTMYGVISGGGGLTKSGLGTMVLRSINPYVGETVIKKGTLEVTPLSIATDAQNIIIGGVALGTSNILRLQGGTFKTSGGSSVANESYPMHIYVEGSDTSGLMPNRLADLNGNVSGSGTLLYTIPYLREIIKGDWSEYTGTLIAYGSNATDGSILMIDNGGKGDGIPNGRVVATGNTKICTYSNNLSISFGGLATEQAGVKLSCGGSKNIGFGKGYTTYSVGGANTDETFKGIINNELYGSATATDGTTTIIKEGDGLWRLTGTNPYSGTTTIIGGKLVVNGTHAGTGAFTVTQGILAGKGSIAADVDVADTLQPGDNSIDKLTLKGKLTLESTSVTQVDINRSTSTTFDNIAVTGAIVYGGTLQVALAGTPVNGDVFKIFTVGSTYSGTFAQILPTIPAPGLVWKFRPFSGELLAVTSDFVNVPTQLALATTTDGVTAISVINLTWQDNSNNETNFILERSTDGVNFADISHPAAAAVSYIDNNLSPVTTYYYRIKAIGATSSSVYSNIVSITTPTAPIPTLTLTATTSGVTATSIVNNAWVFSSPNTVNYILERSVDGINFSNISTPAANAVSYADNGLAPATMYYYRIKAAGTSSASAYSTIVSITTPPTLAPPTAATTPSPANSQVDIAVSNGKVTLSWSGGSTTASYAVYFGTVSGNLTKLADVAYSGNPTTYQVSGLSNYTIYYWRIDATNVTATTVGTQWNFRTIAVDAVTGDFRSSASGPWETLATWQTYDGTAWNAATGVPNSSTTNATIKSGHTVTIAGTTGVTNLTIEPTAILKTDGSNRNLRIGKSVINYGTFGSSGTVGERINFEGYLANGTVTLGGTSTYYINAFNVNSIAVKVTVFIDANLSINGALRGYYSNSTTAAAGQNDDDVTITINQGKAVTMTTTGLLGEPTSPSTNTIAEFGNYTYNINGTLDMRLTGTSCIVAHSTIASSNITINTNGLWYTGNAMRLISTATSTVGGLNVNIGNAGIVDAGARNAAAATTATAPVITNLVMAPIFFNITGNGVLKNRVGTTEVLYPIGTNGTYSPVKLTNTGTIDMVAVGLNNTFDSVVNNASQVVNKQYTIKSNLTSGPNMTIALGWLTSDQSNGFTSTTSVIGHYNGSVWDEKTAVVTGAGSVSSPYYAKASGYTSFSPFGVGNVNAFVPAVLPFQLLSFQAVYTGNQTNLLWASVQEVGVKEFLVERSLDGINFLSIGNIAAKNMVGVNKYAFADVMPLNGISYYRLKIVDVDSSITYSKIVGIDTKQAIELSIFPNPASNRITVTHTTVSNTSTISILDMNGRLVKSVSLIAGTIQTEINIADLAKGNYVVKINNGAVSTLMFTKQ